jgi:hypothetical protein
MNSRVDEMLHSRDDIVHSNLEYSQASDIRWSSSTEGI